MNDGDALLASVLAAPDDDAPRLVYADWLDEHGEGERAELIRVQSELATMMPTTIRCKRAPPDDMRSFHRNCRWCHLRLRERKLLLTRLPGTSTGRPSENTRAAARYVWAGPIAQLEDPDGNGWQFRRGFIDSITCTAADWLAHADAILAQHPVQTVRLTTWPEISWGPVMRHEVPLAEIPEIRKQLAGWDGVFDGKPKRFACQQIIRPYATPEEVRDTRQYFGRMIELARTPRGYLRECWPSVKTWHLPETATLGDEIERRFLDRAERVIERRMTDGPISPTSGRIR